jgi:hypothetical protein
MNNASDFGFCAWLVNQQIEITDMKKLLLVIYLVFVSPAVTATAPTPQIISLKCSYAIAAVIGEMGTQTGTQTGNKVMQEALSLIDENNGEFVCLQPEDGKIYVGLQSTEMTTNDNRLLFTINPLNYEIERTIYGK